MMRCFCCESEFHPSLGRHISGYEFDICGICYSANREGWPPFYAKRILAHLRARDLAAPSRNATGRLPRDWPMVQNSAPINHRTKKAAAGNDAMGNDGLKI
jgi:hypothetical protein